MDEGRFQKGEVERRDGREVKRKKKIPIKEVFRLAWRGKGDLVDYGL